MANRVEGRRLVRLVVEVDPELHDTISAYAALTEVTRKSVVIEALEEYLNKRSFAPTETKGKAA